MPVIAILHVKIFLYSENIYIEVIAQKSNEEYLYLLLNINCISHILHPPHSSQEKGKKKQIWLDAGTTARVPNLVEVLDKLLHMLALGF